jgi:hypothetical protein
LSSNEGVDQRVEERQLRDAVADQKAEIVQTDPFAGPPDLGIGKAKPGAKAKWIGQEQQQQNRRRQHEQQAQRITAVLQFLEQYHGCRRSGLTTIVTLRPCSSAQPAFAHALLPL